MTAHHTEGGHTGGAGRSPTNRCNRADEDPRASDNSSLVLTVALIARRLVLMHGLTVVRLTEVGTENASDLPRLSVTRGRTTLHSILPSSRLTDSFIPGCTAAEILGSDDRNRAPRGSRRDRREATGRGDEDRVLQFHRNSCDGPPPGGGHAGARVEELNAPDVPHLAGHAGSSLSGP